MKKAAILLMLLPVVFAQDRRIVGEPKIPPRCTTLAANLVSQSATIAASDETKLDTPRIQHALDTCKPGHAVTLQANGRRDAFLTGPLDLRPGVTLVVDKGAILFGSRNPRDYDVEPGICGTITERGHGCRAMINGSRVTGAGVMGDGIIDGRGGYSIIGQSITWWDLAEKARSGGVQNNPRIMILSGCDDFTLYRIQLRNSPNFHVSYSGGHGFTAWGVIVNAPRNARNTDGINPGNSTDVTITRSFIHSGDDNVAIKAPEGEPTAHMTIAHNHFYAGHGMSIGSETDGGASAIRVSDLSIDGADNGIRIKSNFTRGGSVHDIEYEDVCIRNTKNPVMMDSHYTAGYSPGKDKLPHFTDIRLKNVRVSGSGTVTLEGYDALHPLGIRFDNVVFENPDLIKLKAAYADVTAGPGPFNLRPSGNEVRTVGVVGEGPSNVCASKWVPFPVPISQ